MNADSSWIAAVLTSILAAAASMPAWSACPGQCDDRNLCTLDACVNDACTHTYDTTAAAMCTLDVEPNSWVNRDPLNTVFPPGFRDGLTSSDAWSQLVADGNGQVYFYESYDDLQLLGGNIYGNTLYVYDPAQRERRAVKIHNYSNCDPIQPDQTLDPTPIGRHTYRGFTVDTDRNDLYLLYGAHSGCHPDGTLWRYSLNQGQDGIDGSWEALPAPPIEANERQFESNLFYFEGSLYWFASNTSAPPYVRRYNIATNTWEARADAPRRFWASSTTVDVRRRQLVFFGGRFSETERPEMWAYRPDTDSWEMLSGNLPDGPMETEGGANQGGEARIAYNSRFDVYMVLTSTEPMNTWVFHPDDQRWEQLDVTPPPRLFKNSEWAFTGYLAYDPVQDSLVASKANEDFYVFRYAPPAVPKAPSNVRKLTPEELLNR